MTVTDEFRAARYHLVSLQQEWERAREEFVWPRVDHVNFGLDWFDQLAASPERRDQDALIILEEDGFGQTETTLQVANTPGPRIRIGSMGVPLPGFEVAVVDPVTGEESSEGELCLRLDPRPVGLMRGYYGEPGLLPHQGGTLQADPSDRVPRTA